MKSDLHLHSRYSDGTLWPNQVAERAAASGLECIALTDHDSMEGVVEFAAAAERLGIVTVPGAEIDCVAPEIGFDSELLVYFPEGGGERTAALLRERLAAREARIRRLLSAAGSLFGRDSLDFEELRRIKMGDNSCRGESRSFQRA